MSSGTGQLNLRRLMGRQLRGRLVLATTLQLVIVSGAIGSLAYFSGHRSGLKLGDRYRRQAAISGLAEQLSSRLQATRTINALNALAFEQGDLPLDRPDDLARQFWRQMQLYPVGYINFGGVDGSFIGVERRNSGELVLNLDVAEGAVGRGKLGIYALGALGQRGRLLEVVPDMSPTHQEAWYTETVAADRPTWSSFYQWEDSPEVFAISFNQPLRDRQNRLIGVIGVDFVLTQLSTWLQQLWARRRGAALIVEANGMVVASSRPGWTLQGTGKEQRRARIDQLDDAGLKLASSSFFTRQGSQLRLRSTATKLPLLEHRQGESHQLISLQPWGKDLGLSWYLIIAKPVETATLSSERAALWALAGSLVALTLAFLLTRELTGWLLRPLERLRRDARHAAAQLQSQRVAGTASGVEFTAELPDDSATEISEVSSAFADLVNQLNQLTTALLEKEQRLEQLLDGLPVAIAVLDASDRGPVHFTNQAFRRSFGRAAAQLPSVAAWRQHWPQWPDLATVSLQGREAQIRTQAGELLTVLVFTGLNDSRRVEAYLDLTAMRQAERQLAEALERERLKDAETVLLLQDKLRSSLQAAAVAHEINLPLSNLLLNAKLLLGQSDTPLPPELEELLGGIARNAEQVVLTIEKMRALLRNVQTSHQPLNLANVVRSALLYLRPVLQASGIQVERHGLDSRPTVVGDQAQIQIAVVNLLRNAIEALEQASTTADCQPPLISVGLVREPGRVSVVVSDNGPGFSSLQLARQPLETSKQTGTGLGLFLAETTMANHHGELALGRSPQGGAEARLVFPLGAEASPPTWELPTSR
jgi:C4-dicarboxylate-specific signal transduction histidine kinase